MIGYGFDFSIFRYGGPSVYVELAVNNQILNVTSLSRIGFTPESVAYSALVLSS